MVRITRAVAKVSKACNANPAKDRSTFLFDDDMSVDVAPPTFNSRQTNDAPNPATMPH
jgi:hypothetical protein